MHVSEIDELMEHARKAVAIPFEFGHGDVGYILVRFLQGKVTNEAAINQIDNLAVYYTEQLER